MKKDIIVVGAGHGGLIAATKLAQKGFKVSVYEKNSLENLSWDWGDNFDLKVFKRIGLPEPDKSLYQRPANFRLSSPDEQYVMSTDVPVEFRDIYMERRFLARLLVEHAQDAGAEILFSKNIQSVIIKNKKIIGIKSKEEEIYGDLIIDSAGVKSPIKSQLPEEYCIDATLHRGELFYTYRGYFNKLEGDSTFNVTLGFKGMRGISWVNTSFEYADVLIGRIDPFKKGEKEALIQDLRKRYPSIGEKLLRGGQITLIPIRRTAPLLIGANYAVVGDAAYMTVPISGSGIANSMVAGDILANVIIEAHENSNNPYSIENLWPYQYLYYREIGSDMAFIDLIKNFLMVTPFNDINYLFRKRILTAKDFEASIIGNEVKMGFFDILGRIFRGFGRLGLLLSLGNQMMKATSLKKHCLNIPKAYDENNIKLWRDKGEKYFEAFYKKLETQ